MQAKSTVKLSHIWVVRIAIHFAVYVARVQYIFLVDWSFCGGYHFLVEMLLCFLSYYVVPSGVPQAVIAKATGSSSIFVQWDRVGCIERNSEITGYTIRYAPLGGSSSDITILGTTRNDRIFTITGLRVSTYYTVMVAANHSGVTTGPFSVPIPVKTLGKYTWDSCKLWRYQQLLLGAYLF